MKMTWNLVANPEMLWVQVMRAKYCCGAHAMPKVGNRINCSNIWRAIANNW